MTTTAVTPTRPALPFWAAWVAATTAGMLAGVFIALSVGYGLGDIVTRSLGEFAGQVTVGLGFGLGIGLGLFGPQWLLLRSRLPGSLGYVWGGVLGAMAGLAIAFPLSSVFGDNPGPLTALLFGGLVGLSAGAGQWLALRGKFPVVWVVISVVAMAISLTSLFALSAAGREVLTSVIAGLVQGALSGAGALRVLKNK